MPLCLLSPTPPRHRRPCCLRICQEQLMPWENSSPNLVAESQCLTPQKKGTLLPLCLAPPQAWSPVWPRPALVGVSGDQWPATGNKDAEGSRKSGPRPESQGRQGCRTLDHGPSPGPQGTLLPSGLVAESPQPPAAQPECWVTGISTVTRAVSVRAHPAPAFGTCCEQGSWSPPMDGTVRSSPRPHGLPQG